jgi:5-oxopent-3-ene-1,2,5-tricarboxylate decarboxylase/2-hydroxyhepta-2,4-diene-1,7-dioate isomerase
LRSDLEELEASAALAVVFARDARCVSSAEAFETVVGYTLALDLSEPGADFFRPPIREKCCDGFLPIGPSIVGRHDLTNLEDLVIHLEIDGEDAASFSLQGGAARIGALIEEVSGFMTFRAGDVLLACRTPLGPHARRGSRISARADGFGRLDCILDIDKKDVL